MLNFLFTECMSLFYTIKQHLTATSSITTKPMCRVYWQDDEVTKEDMLCFEKIIPVTNTATATGTGATKHKHKSSKPTATAVVTSTVNKVSLTCLITFISTLGNIFLEVSMFCIDVYYFL